MNKKYTVIEDYPKRIAEWLKRAGAWCEYDDIADTLTITSRNTEQPVTNSEKIAICKYLVIRKHAFRSVRFREVTSEPYGYTPDGIPVYLQLARGCAKSSLQLEMMRRLYGIPDEEWDEMKRKAAESLWPESED